MSCSTEAAKPINGNNDVILKPADDIQTQLKKVHYKDLYVTGKVWVDALKVRLHHVKTRLTPAVPEKEALPEKPPPMKYKDLPIYESPHYTYKDFIERHYQRPEADVKILQSFLFPIVHKYRRPMLESFYKMSDDFKGMGNEARQALCNKMSCFKMYLRDPDNVKVGRAVLGLSTATGIYIGCGTRSITRKLFTGTLGALGGGALCFPKETDVIFKDSVYIIARLAVALYNGTCGVKLFLQKQFCSENIPPKE